MESSISAMDKARHPTKHPVKNPITLSDALGLAGGIIIFFNHIGKRRITHDPTPIEVSMRKYEMKLFKDAEKHARNRPKNHAAFIEKYAGRRMCFSRKSRNQSSAG